MSIDNILNNPKKYYIPKTRTSKSLSYMRNIFFGALLGSSLVLGINYYNHQKIKNSAKEKIQYEIKSIIEQYNFDKEINDAVFSKVNQHFENNPNLIDNTFKNSVDEMISNFIDEIKVELNQYSKNRLQDNLNSILEPETGIENNVVRVNWEEPVQNTNNVINQDSNRNSTENTTVRETSSITPQRISRNQVFFDHYSNPVVKESVQRVEEIINLVKRYDPDKEYFFYVDKLINRMYLYDLKENVFLKSLDVLNNDRRGNQLPEGLYSFSNSGTSNSIPYFSLSHSENLDNNYSRPLVEIDKNKFDIIQNEIDGKLEKIIFVNENRSRQLNIHNAYR